MGFTQLNPENQTAVLSIEKPIFMSLCKTILFAPHFNNTFSEMLPIALRLRDLYDYKIHFSIDWVPYAPTIDKCQENDVTYTILGGAVNSIPDKTFREQEKRRPKWFFNFWERFKSIPVGSELARLAWQVLFQSKLQRQASRLVTNLDPSVIVTYRDDTPRISTFLAHIGNSRNVPAVLFPTQVISNTAAVQMAWAKGQTLSNLSLGQKMMYWFVRLEMPQLISEWKGEDVLFLPPEAALVAYAKKIVPDNPWIRGGGGARFTAVANPHDYEALVEKGIAADTIILTGYPPLDRFCEQDLGLSRDVLCQKLGIPKNRFIACYAAYPLLTGQEDQLPVSFAEMRAHERFLVDTLLNISFDVHVIFKLHPRSRLDDYDFLPSKNDHLIVIRDMDINDAIAGCDLFTTYSSTSLYIAVALKKPILTFGFYNDQAYEDVLKPLRGIYKANNRDEFEQAARRAINDCRSGKNDGRIAAEEAKRFSICDGRSTERFCEVVHSLAEKPGNRPDVAL